MKKILFILTAFLALITTGCQEDDLGKGGYAGPENGFRLSYTINDPASVITKSSLPSEQEENKINSFYILFFENSTDGSGEFVDVIDVKDTFGNDLASAGELDITFPAGSKINKDKDYKLLFCANIELYAANISGANDIETLCQGMTEKEANAILLQVTGVTPSGEEELDDSNRILSANLPMSAMAVKSASTKNITVELNRIVSRFDIYCKVPGYQLVSAAIWNANTVVPIWNQYNTTPAQVNTERFYGVDAIDGQIVASLYAFENKVESPSQNDQVTTCVIVGLKNTEGNIEYFRININPATGVGQELKRNNVYRTFILGVKGMGSTSEREAYESSQSLLETDINGWFAGTGGNVIISGDRVLVVPTLEMRFYAHGEVRDYYFYTIGEGRAYVTSVSNASASNVEEGNVGVFKRYKLRVGPGKVDNEKYVILTFVDIKVKINITLEESILERYINLAPSDQQYFAPLASQSSGDIVVNSSGKWKAEIYNGDYFSFETDRLVSTISGNPGESFKVHTIRENLNAESRYSFVLVYLEDMETVSDVIVLQQYGGDQCLLVNPNTFQPLSSGGGQPPILQ